MSFQCNPTGQVCSLIKAVYFAANLGFICGKFGAIITLYFCKGCKTYEDKVGHVTNMHLRTKVDFKRLTWSHALKKMSIIDLLSVFDAPIKSISKYRLIGMTAEMML